MAASMARPLLYFILIETLLIAYAADTPGSEDKLCSPPDCVNLDLQNAPLQVDVKKHPLGGSKICVLCFPGLDKRWYRLWANPQVKIQLQIVNDSYEVYHGSSLSEVLEASKSKSYLRWPSVWGQLHHEYAFQPFNASCIGVSAQTEYSLNFEVKNPELWFVFSMAVGLLLFFFASSWSSLLAGIGVLQLIWLRSHFEYREEKRKNTFLHYGAGISVGVLGSVLIALFIVNKFLPQKIKTLGSFVLVVSTSASMFLLQHVSVYFNDILLKYWEYFLAYVCVASLLSFVIIYRYGPVSNPRTLDLVRWSLQAMGLALVYCGSQMPEMGVAIIATAFLCYHFPRGFGPWLRKIRMRYFPPRLRLLTEEEYYKEGQVETEKALRELREYCRSPECDAWKTISRLNTSSRFGRFMGGDDHVTDAESCEHDSTCDINPLDLEDDSSSESEISLRITR